MDRGGTFLGTLRVIDASGSKVDLGQALLSAGLAKLHSSFDPDRTPGGRDLAAAQDKARAAKLKVRKTLDCHRLHAINHNKVRLCCSWVLQYALLKHAGCSKNVVDLLHSALGWVMNTLALNQTLDIHQQPAGHFASWMA